MRDVATKVSWSIMPPVFATIDSSGLLHAMLVMPDRSQTVTATLNDAAVTLTASRNILIRDVGYIKIIGPKSLGERGCAALAAVFTSPSGTPIRDVTADTTWSVSPGEAAQIGADGLFMGLSVDADRVETVTASAMVDGVLQVSTASIKVLNAVLQGGGVLLDDGFGDRDSFDGAIPGGVAIGPDGRGVIAYSLSRYVSGQSFSEVDVARQLPSGCWVVSTLGSFASYPWDPGTQVWSIIPPTFVAGQPVFAAETFTGGLYKLRYYSFDGASWHSEEVSQRDWSNGARSQLGIVVDTQGRPNLLMWAVLSDTQVAVRRYVLNPNGWSEENLDRSIPSGELWNVAMDGNGGVWRLRGPLGGPYYLACLTDPSIPERPYASADGQPLSIIGSVMALDRHNRVYQVFADAGGPVSVIRPIEDKFLREVVDSFGWGADGSQRIIFDADDRPVVFYGMSAVGSCGPGCYRSLWDEVRAATLVNENWIVRRVDGTSETSGQSAITCRPAFDQAGNLHVGLIVISKPDGVYYGFLPTGSSVLTGGDFSDPSNFTLYFDLKNPTADNDVSIVTLPNGNRALRLYSGTGEPFGITQDTQPSTVFTISFRYRFGNEAKMILKLGGETLALMPSPSEGPGSPGSNEWALYNQIFDLQQLGLNPQPPYTLELLLAAAADPELLLDDLRVVAGIPTVPDFDLDADVDLDDWKAFQTCVSGPDIPFRAGCGAEDLDRDGDVDQGDFGAFQRCYSGDNTPAVPNCAD